MNSQGLNNARRRAVIVAFWIVAVVLMALAYSGVTVREIFFGR
jgi:hypothetical protein